MTTATVRIFPDPETLGRTLAARLLAEIAAAHGAGRGYLLGCPNGRSARPVYQAMATALAAAAQDLSRLVLVMMDDYLADLDGRLEHVDAGAHHSCRRFGREEILDVLNAPLPAVWRVPAEQLWFPDPAAPARYDERIAAAGGVDFFILASGAGDGHVALNPPGTAADSPTRVLPLAEQTRRDNLKTFPDFTGLDEVPQFSISIGIGTIARQSKAVAMVLWGADKREAFIRITTPDRYDDQWPASLVNLCRRAEILADAAAAGVAGAF